jgi:hypothetical protein
VSDASKAEPTGGDEPVPKLPRGRGLKLSGPELFRIALTIVALIGLVVLTKPCARAVSGFVTSFDNDKDPKKAMPKPGNVDVPTQGSDDQFEHLTPGMTEQEIKAAVERSKARNAANAGSAAAGSAAAGSAHAGSSHAGSGTAPAP